MSTAAVVNGGWLSPPTFLPRTAEEAAAHATKVLKESTTRDMLTLMRMNVVKGSGRRAEVPGFVVGGKTGTAEKVVNGRYANDVRFNAFLAAFPIDNPRYIVLAIIDEPKSAPDGGGVTAGLNAAPMVGEIIRRSAALLGVQPTFGEDGSALLVSY